MALWDKCDQAINSATNSYEGLSKIHDPKDRLDSGICESFQSDSLRSDSIGSTGTKSIDSNDVRFKCQRNPQQPPKQATKLDTWFSDHKKLSLDETTQQLEELKIEEPSTEIPQQSFFRSEIITLEQLKARTKEQKLRDLEHYDFNTFVESKPKESEERCDSGLCEGARCSSLTEEEERPPHFQQDADGDT